MTAFKKSARYPATDCAGQTAPSASLLEGECLAHAGRAVRCLVALALVCALLPVPHKAFAQEAAADARESDGAVAAVSIETVSAGGSFCAGEASPLEGLVPGEDYVADEVLITLSGDASLSDVEQVAADAGSSLAGVVRADDDGARLASDGLSAGDVAVLRADEGAALSDVADELLASDEVAAVQPNYLYDLVDDSLDASGAGFTSQADPLAASLAETTQYIPNDPAFSDVDRCWQYDRVGAYAAWASARSNGMVKVAVVDSGINASHEDLSGAIDADDAYNSNTATAGINAVADTVGHGSHVAGSIAAVANNKIGTCGLSFGACIVPIKCTYSAGAGDTRKAPTSAVAAGIRYAVGLGVQVINLSIGTQQADAALQAAVSEAIAADVCLVCAAGNNVGESPYYPSDYEGVVSVTAIDSFDTIASFSGHNDHKTVAAPGVGIYSLSSGGSSSYATLSGTSMAASVASGALAVLRGANPNLSAHDVEQALYETADDAGDPGRDPYYGWGIMRLDKACQVVTEDPVRGFTDMDAQDWYTASDGFGWSVSMGYLRGYEGTTLFGPYDGITRGQLVTMLWRAAGKKNVSAQRFDDVDYSLFYGDAISWARATGVVRGYDGTNRFDPDAMASRQEVACIFANYARQIAHVDTSSTCEKLDTLVDSGDVAEWARPSFGWCVDAGIISGVKLPSGERAADPDSGAWRASAAWMLTALLRDVLA